ncbi:MAG: PLP-dependent transferase, partial [Candidatus Eremiobacteraeota bacterium]|nr:PLP-dependent transferase [Candidatus Eremiobacteraeota bacterium]
MAMLPVDLRSDTLTTPTAAMRAAMAAAEVGDDVFGEDPTVRALEAKAAALAGQEAGLFVPSGTMGNQLAILSWCQRGDDVLVGEGAHAYLYESGAGAVLAGVQFTVVGRGGHFTPAEVRAAAHTTDAAGHIPPSTLLMVENTHNRGGGKVMGPA